MKRLALALCVVALAACSRGGQSGSSSAMQQDTAQQMMPDSAHRMMSDTAKAPATTKP
jgi:hypothetical protein